MHAKIETIRNPGVPGTLSYNLFYYHRTIKGILRKHRLIFNGPRYGRDSNFRFDQPTINRWYELFDVPEDVQVPFTCHDFARTAALMEIVDDMGVNFKHLLHLKCELWFHRPLVSEQSYTIDYVFEDVRRIRKDKGAVIGFSAIRQGEDLYVEVRDHFVVKEVPESDLERLQPDESNQFKELKNPPVDHLSNSCAKELHIPTQLSKRYGATSGDKNIIHTSAWAARFFGYERPFIQGLCTANLIIKELCLKGIDLKYFSIIFCRPVYLDSTVQLSFTDTDYRLRDEAGSILCFGQINSKG
ncbi:MAG: MaoC family dehydratase [Acidobacteriota bacterium]